MLDGTEGEDVRAGPVARRDVAAPPQTESRHDPSITFEEYMYWATITRADELVDNAKYIAERGPVTLKSLVKDRFSTYKYTPQAAVRPEKPAAPPAADAASGNQLDEKTGDKEQETGSDSSTTGDNTLDSRPSGDDEVITSVTADEWKRASRAIRTAGWGGVFYLITTDILGPFSAP